MPYLILCETLPVSWLYLTGQGFLIERSLFFVFGIGSLIWLTILEHRTRLPLPFIGEIDGVSFLAVLAIAFGATLAAYFGIPYVYWYMRRGPLALLSLPSIMSAINAGITEESFKVAFTNTLTMVWQKTPIGGKSKNFDRAILYITGTGSVALWAWLHIQLKSYSIEFGVTAFIVGMVYFAIVLVSKNYLPTVVAHALFDWRIS